MQMKEGELVKFRDNLYWVYEVCPNSQVVLIPEADWDFLQQTIFLGRAIKTSVKHLDPPS
jgi:hypothetical protein